MKVETVGEVMSALSRTAGGLSLKEIYRWSTFRRGEADKVWREILGMTAQDFSHGLLMYRIAANFLHLEKGRFSPEKEGVFLYGVLCHDWGEAIINGQGVGDVSAQVKTAEVENRESVIVRRVIASLSLPAEVKEQLLEGYEQVVEGMEEELYDAFRALEKTEYVITAMKVFQNCSRLRARGFHGLEDEIPLIGRVLVINLSQILDTYVSKFPHSIGLLFRTQVRLIDEMYEYVYPWLAECKTWAGKPVDHAKLSKDFEARWAAFRG